MFDIFSLLALVALVYFYFAHTRLRERVDALERSLGADGVRTPSPVPSAALPLDAAALSATPVAVPAPSAAYLARDTGPTWWDRFTLWLKEDWLLKLGALLILIGFGWFVTYAFMHNWIGPMGRITFGFVVGALFLAFGWWRMQRYKEQGAIFLVLGATAILITMFAARYVYNFFTPLSAMAITFLASAFVGLASVKYRVHSLAFCGLILASIVPLLVGSRDYDEIMRFYYLFLVTLGILWIVLLTGWHDLLVAALCMVTLYSLPHWTFSSMRHFADAPVFDTITYIAFGFVIVFFLANVFAFLFAREGASRSDIVGAIWTGIFLVCWVFSGVDREWQSLVFAGWTVAFVVGAFLLFAKTGNRKPLITYAGVGIMLLGIATARELDGSALTIAFTLEAAVATFLAHRLLRDRGMTLWTSALFIVPVALSLESIARYPRYGRSAYTLWESAAPTQTPIFHEHFFALFVLAAAFFVLWYFTKRIAGAEASPEGKGVSIAQFHLVVGSAYAYLLLWLMLHELFPSDTATMLALLAYTIVGLGVYLHGRRNDLKVYRIYGGFLLGFVVIRLLIVEVWNMELAGRIITFFLVGALLMSTAFIGRRKKEDATGT